MQDQEIVLAELPELPWATSLSTETQRALADRIRIVEAPSGSVVVEPA